MAYILDSNVLIQAKNFHYSFSICPGFWMWIEKAHARNSLLSVDRVLTELTNYEDKLSNWVSLRKHMFAKTGDGKTINSLAEISKWTMDTQHPDHHDEFLSSADYVIVGFAHAHGHTVVTHEGARRSHKIQIPTACKAFNVPWMNPFTMLEKEHVQFSLP